MSEFSEFEGHVRVARCGSGPAEADCVSSLSGVRPEAKALGCGIDGELVYFSIHAPQGPESPLVVEVPHAGLWVDGPALATLAAPARALGQDADLYVDELFADAPLTGAHLLTAHVSRYVCDLNRSLSDVDALAAQGGTARLAPHGLVWRSTTEDLPALVAPVSAEELARRIELIYRPYHTALRELLEAKRQKFGYVILLCAHSMPSRGRAGHTDPGQDRADVVPGSRSRTSAAGIVIDELDRVSRDFGYSVMHDTPYRGGFSTGFYGRPAQGQHAVQIELARRLYMDEKALTKKPRDFEETRRFCRQLTEALARLSLPRGSSLGYG